MTGVRDDLAHASAILDLKRYDEAASLLAHIVAAAPADSRAWCLLATAHLGRGRYQDAAAAASRAVTLAPSDDWPYRLASTAQRHLGNIAAALSAANEACRLAPDEWRGYLCLAQAQLATEVDFMAAEQAAANALRLAPDEPDAHFIAGRVSYAQERWKAARAHHERALALDPAHSGALNELGRIRVHRGGYARAVQHFLQAARSTPHVSAYGRNVEVAIQRVVALMLSSANVALGALLLLTLAFRATRGTVMIVFTVIAALIAGYGAVQLWRMPPEMRPLFRTRRVALALGAAYGSILIAVITAAVTPIRSLPGALLAVMVLIFTSSFAARAITRRKRTNTSGQTRAHDRAA